MRVSAGRAGSNNGGQGSGAPVDQDEYLETQSSLDEDN